jgi:hypothetical protein
VDWKEVQRRLCGVTLDELRRPVVMKKGTQPDWVKCPERSSLFCVLCSRAPLWLILKHIDNTTRKLRSDALCVSVINKDPRITELLITRGVDAEKTCALHCAATLGRTEHMELLWQNVLPITPDLATWCVSGVTELGDWQQWPLLTIELGRRPTDTEFWERLIADRVRALEWVFTRRPELARGKAMIAAMRVNHRGFREAVFRCVTRFTNDFSQCKDDDGQPLLFPVICNNDVKMLPGVLAGTPDQDLVFEHPREQCNLIDLLFNSDTLPAAIRAVMACPKFNRVWRESRAWENAAAEDNVKVLEAMCAVRGAEFDTHVGRIAELACAHSSVDVIRLLRRRHFRFTRRHLSLARCHSNTKTERTIERALPRNSM